MIISNPSLNFDFLFRTIEKNAYYLNLKLTMIMVSPVVNSWDALVIPDIKICAFHNATVNHSRVLAASQITFKISS